MVDWGEALRIGGTGFGLVFAVLIVLAIAIGIVAWGTHKVSTIGAQKVPEAKTEDGKEEKEG
jgi:Na+-transporting methylmalonyl-CoA/oxaloacetate decarboxylase gamma subunit